MDLKGTRNFASEQIKEVLVETFDVAYSVIGGGEDGDKRRVQTKEEADHSLPYMVAAAILDGGLSPDQYSPERVRRADAQFLLRKIRVRPLPDYSRRFPEEMPARVVIYMRNGETLIREKKDYEGFHTRPMTEAAVRMKFRSLTAPYTSHDLCDEIIDDVTHLEDIRVTDLMQSLSKIGALWRD